MISSDFFHIMFYHDLNKLLEAGGLWVPGSTGSPADEFLDFARFLSLSKDPRDLLDDTFFQVLSKISTHYACNMVGCYLFHVVTHHNLYQFFERGSLRIPS